MLARCLLLLLVMGAARAEVPLLYVPFDGTMDAVAAGGDARERTGALAELVAGIRGQALPVRQDVRFDSERNFRARAGTVAFWLRPEWPGDSPEFHYLFSLYGGEDVHPRWLSNRWGLSAQGGRLAFTVHDGAAEAHSVEAPIAAWRAGEWHHLAATWTNVGSGKPDAELRLYVDGVEAGTPVVGASLPVGRVGETLDIGRDSDASPDYADAAVDDLYIYARALRAEEIARAVRAVRAGDGPAPARAAPLKVRRAPGWRDPERPYRVRITIPAEKRARDQVFAALPLDLSSDLSSLGRHGRVDPGSLRLLTGDGSQAVPFQVRDGRLEWVAGALPAGRTRDYALYFRAVAYAFPAPLLAAAPRFAPAPPSAALRVPDYATDAYGDAWDFNEGDLEAIDQWGNKPELIRGRTVENGVLKIEVSDDPWFIWGDMWGQVPRSQRPVQIDLARYPVLEMRVRQSVSQAVWELYGRPDGTSNLLTHELEVSGTGWQTIRIDLRREARWGGTLTALRIDPTRKVEAHVEIDWVRLSPLHDATRAAVEALGDAPRPAARVTLSMPHRQPRVGSRQVMRAKVVDAGGRPVAGHPVRLALGAGSGGSLEMAAGSPSLGIHARARRALTGPDGTAAFLYRVSRRAGTAADRLQAAAEFSAAPPAGMAVRAVPGPPHHYMVMPAQPRVLRPGDPPLATVARLADAFGNPLPGGGRVLRWSAPGARLQGVAPRTAADGSARAVFRTDAEARWVTRIRVQDDAGLAGESAPISVLPAGPKAEPVRLLPNGYFEAGGKPWLPLGGFYANWVGTPSPDGEWNRLVSFTDATEEQIVAWLRLLKESGVTAQRFMLRTHRKDGMEPMDIGGRVNPGLFAAFLRYLDLAHPFGIRFLLVLHEDYTKPLYYDRFALERYALPWFAGIDLGRLPAFQRRFVRDRDLIQTIGEKYTDRDAIACQDRYAREIVGLLRGNPQVFAYELENEMVDCPAEWANHAIDTIRAVDPDTPVCVSHGGGGLHTADPAWWKEKTSIDFYSYHLYPHGTTTPEVDYGTLVDVLARYGSLGKPAFLGESAGDQFSLHPDRETRRWTMRDVIWFSLINANPGCFFWNARASEVAEFRLAREIAGRVDWRTFRRKRPAIAVAVPHPLDDDKWFRTPAGGEALAMMGRYARHYLDRGVAFDFALEASGYPLSAEVNRFAPPEPPAPDFSITSGFQLAALVREGDGEALVYVRSFAGTQLWEAGEQYGWQQYLRARRPAPLRVTVRLPGSYLAHLWDLDTGRHEERTLASGEELDLGTTDHDFALHLAKR